MIAAMVNIKEERRSLLLVVLEKDNLDRMARADAVTLESIAAGGALQPPMYPFNLSLLIATELNHEELVQRAKGDTGEFIRWLERGRQFIEGVDGVVHTHVIKTEGA